MILDGDACADCFGAGEADFIAAAKAVWRYAPYGLRALGGGARTWLRARCDLIVLLPDGGGVFKGFGLWAPQKRARFGY